MNPKNRGPAGFALRVLCTIAIVLGGLWVLGRVWEFSIALGAGSVCIIIVLFYRLLDKWYPYLCGILIFGLINSISRLFSERPTLVNGQLTSSWIPVLMFFYSALGFWITSRSSDTPKTTFEKTALMVYLAGYVVPGYWPELNPRENSVPMAVMLVVAASGLFVAYHRHVCV